MDSYGIRGNAFKLLKSYLTGKTQYVMYDGMSSATLPSKCGTLLFICTVNDIENISDFLYTILYTDDTCVLLNGKQYNDLVKFLNLEVEKLSN